MGPTVTAVLVVKFVPVMVITVPQIPDVGVKEVIVGAAIKVKPGLTAVPKALVTLTSPVVPVPTVAVILVEELTTND